MKVLFLVQKEQRAILDRLYEGVAEHCECDIRWLSSDEQRNLRGYFRREVDVTRYDRIVFFLRFKQEIRQAGFIRTIPNLVILEHDAYQNYIPCKYTGKFSAHYQRCLRQTSFKRSRADQANTMAGNQRNRVKPC